jgi:DNA invertase Pin-like site-specific DNA recombinase
MLGAEADRIGLQRLHRAVRADDAVLVARALADIRE